jgi:hypothetical protein
MSCDHQHQCQTSVGFLLISQICCCCRPIELRSEDARTNTLTSSLTAALVLHGSDTFRAECPGLPEGQVAQHCRHGNSVAASASRVHNSIRCRTPAIASLLADDGALQVISTGRSYVEGICSVGNSDESRSTTAGMHCGSPVLGDCVAWMHIYSVLINIYAANRTASCLAVCSLFEGPSHPLHPSAGLRAAMHHQTNERTNERTMPDERTNKQTK